MKKEYLNNAIRGILAIAIYFIASLTELNVLILEILNINYQSWSEFQVYAYLVGFQIILCGIIVMVMFDTYKKHFIEFKKDIKGYLSKYIKYWFLTLGLMMASNIIIQFIASNIAPNEQGVQSMLDVAPLYTFISAVIIAPFLEESIFRLSIRKIIPNDNLFIIISGVGFGLLHVIGQVYVWSDWLFIIPYSIPGLIFAYTLVKSNNIFVPMSLHTIHNGILVIIQLLAM